MATSTVPQAMSNLRDVRDTYVNLLLSNGKQTAEPAPHTPRASWTPGHNLSSSRKEHAVHWASPVTPVLTENEIRVAEVAANLVAVGEAEKRNKDTIRALADKLEETERRNHELEAASRSDEKKRKEKRRVSYGEAKRNIHFTPRTPRRSAGTDFGAERRRSRKLERESFRESPLHLEIETLRMEKAQWHQELEKFRSMMSDIRKNTSRLLDERDKLRSCLSNSNQERDAHLQVISRLQRQLDEREHRRQIEKREALNQSPPSPNDVRTRHYNDEINFSNFKTTYEREAPHESNVRHSDTRDRETVSRIQPFSNTEKSITSEEEMSLVQDEFGREEELQTELYLVNQENMRVSERNAALEGENDSLKERIHLLEANAPIPVPTKQHAFITGTETVAGTTSAAVTEAQLANLLDEINILESISVAINFEISPSEADRVQTSLTVTEADSYKSRNRSSIHHDPLKIHKTGKRETEISRDERRNISAVMITKATGRLAAIRTDLCSKYGKWLEAVANDVSSAGGITEFDNADKENMGLFDVSSDRMNTNVINELVESYYSS